MDRIKQQRDEYQRQRQEMLERRAKMEQWLKMADRQIFALGGAIEALDKIINDAQPSPEVPAWAEGKGPVL